MPQLSCRFARLAVWLRGEAVTLLSFFFFFFFFSPAPPLMLLLSERQNRQWDRSPSSACTSLPGAGSAQLSFENESSTRR